MAALTESVRKEKGIMNKARNRFENIDKKRMLSVEEACFYTGLGRTSCREWLNEIGAVKKLGLRVLCDRYVIDEALNQKEA